MADDVGQCEHARAGTADNRVPKGLEVPPAGATGIDDRRDAGAERVTVWVDTVIARVRAGFVRAREDVHVQVNQAGRHVESPAIHNLEGPASVNRIVDGDYFAAAHRDVAERAQPVLRVDHVTAPQEQVELGLARGPA